MHTHFVPVRNLSDDLYRRYLSPASAGMDERCRPLHRGGELLVGTPPNPDGSAIAASMKSMCASIWALRLAREHENVTSNPPDPSGP